MAVMARGLYLKAMHIDPTFAHGPSDLGAALVQAGHVDAAVRCCQRAVACRDAPAEAFFNLNSALRRQGRQQEALAMSWNAIAARFRDRHSDSSWSASSVDAGAPGLPPQTGDGEGVTVACVKWGTKYDAEYVNKLYRGVKRHSQGAMGRFVCFTDDDSGLCDGITAREFPPTPVKWQGWWNKALLFAPQADTSLCGRVVFIDLDTVITGSLADLLAFRGRFGLLGTDELSNEGRTGGYNSSIVCWDAGDKDIQDAVYGQLEALGSCVTDVIIRFDHWLEMTVKRACVLQRELPGQLVEYVGHCEVEVPHGAELSISHCTPSHTISPTLG